MKKFRVHIPPEVETILRHLHPRLKAQIRRALEELERDPYLGKPLKQQLAGFYSFRVAAYRIIYQIRHAAICIDIIDIAARAIVYERAAALLRARRTEGKEGR